MSGNATIQTCTGQCQGSGDPDCFTCEGNGEIEVCDYCFGSGDHFESDGVCPWCDGKGWWPYAKPKKRRRRKG